MNAVLASQKLTDGAILTVGKSCDRCYEFLGEDKRNEWTEIDNNPESLVKKWALEKRDIKKDWSM